MENDRIAGVHLMLLALAAGVVLAPPAPLTDPVRPKGEGVERLLWGERLDVNLAPASALEVLQGLGPTRAGAIVAGRPFCAVSDLLRVRGIGPVTLRRIRASLEVREWPKECAAARN